MVGRNNKQTNTLKVSKNLRKNLDKYYMYVFSSRQQRSFSQMTVSSFGLFQNNPSLASKPFPLRSISTRLVKFFRMLGGKNAMLFPARLRRFRFLFKLIEMFWILLQVSCSSNKDSKSTNVFSSSDNFAWLFCVRLRQKIFVDNGL